MDQSNLLLQIHILFAPFFWGPATFCCRGGCILLMGEKRPLFVILRLPHVSTTSGILDEKGKMFCQHQWIVIKMNEAFNEKHLIKSYPASLKGEIEPQETGKLTTSPLPQPSLWWTLSGAPQAAMKEDGSSPSVGPWFLRHKSSFPCSYVRHLCSLNL